MISEISDSNTLTIIFEMTTENINITILIGGGSYIDGTLIENLHYVTFRNLLESDVLLYWCSGNSLLHIDYLFPTY
jgi:hypothetical protein